MKIITRYILKLFFSILGMVLLCLSSLYLVVGFFERFHLILKHNISWFDVLIYFCCKIPSILTQCIPTAVLLSVVAGIGLLKQNRETIALKAAGMSPLSYTGPVLAAALFIVFFSFLFDEILTRPADQYADQIWDNNIKSRRYAVKSVGESTWFYGKNLIYETRFYDQESEMFEKTTIFYLDEEFNLVKRLDADQIQWEQNRWVAGRGTFIDFSSKELSEVNFKKEELNLPETPDDFKAMCSRFKNLNWLKLNRYNKRLLQKGYQPISYQVELHFRIASAFTPFVMALWGIIIALRSEFYISIVRNAGIALIAAFIYYLLFQIGVSSALAEFLSPFTGVWIANVVFGCAGIYLWKRRFRWF